MTELASVHRLTRASLKKQRAGASFKAIKLKLGFGFGFDEDFWFRWSIRQAVSETMIIMVDANHACDTTAAISRPHTRLSSIASANDPMTYVLRAKSPS
jgi:L-alanine-DL-glutamate epimerase-like enolase superfamily enzyme